MFPPTSLDPVVSVPLECTVLPSKIIMPEAATALISQDLGLNKELDVEFLKESWAYGCITYPQA